MKSSTADAGQAAYNPYKESQERELRRTANYAAASLSDGRVVLCRVNYAKLSPPDCMMIKNGNQVGDSIPLTEKTEDIEFFNIFELRGKKQLLLISDKTIVTFDIATDKMVLLNKSPLRTQVAKSGRDCNGELLKLLPSEKHVVTLSYDHDVANKRVASIWDIETDPKSWRLVSRFDDVAVTDVAVSPDGKRLALLREDDTKIKIYDISNPAKPHFLNDCEPTHKVVDAHFLSDAKTLVCITREFRHNYYLETIDTASNQRLFKKNLENYATILGHVGEAKEDNICIDTFIEEGDSTVHLFGLVNCEHPRNPKPTHMIERGWLQQLEYSNGKIIKMGEKFSTAKDIEVIYSVDWQNAAVATKLPSDQPDWFGKNVMAAEPQPQPEQKTDDEPSLTARPGR